MVDINTKISEVTYKLSLKETVESFTKKLFYGLFDADYMTENHQQIKRLFLTITEDLKIENNLELWKQYKGSFSVIKQKLSLDAIAIHKNDPAAKSLEEVYLAYPGFQAISIYRLSHQLHKLNVPVLPRMMSEYVHGITGIDIHPGAQIGASFFIDHGTGIVIGETTIIKNHVKIFQGVTLGGMKVKKNLASTKRHPTIENNVAIYANATILGGDVNIGEDAIIGANVCVTKSIPSRALVTYTSEITISRRHNEIK